MVAPLLTRRCDRILLHTFMTPCVKIWKGKYVVFRIHPTTADTAIPVSDGPPGLSFGILLRVNCLDRAARLED